MPADAWAVQVGSFAAYERAVALRDQLRSDGYHALFSNVKKGNEKPDKLTRVAVGPMIDREDAVRLKAELTDRYGARRHDCSVRLLMGMFLLASNDDTHRRTRP